MVIQYVSSDTLGIKSATTTSIIKHDGKIKIGDKEIEGPGEYDIAGVGVHAFSSYAVFFMEGIRLAAVWKNGVKIDNDEDTSLDIFAFLTTDAKDVTTLIKEQDPRIVVLHNPDLASALQQSDGIHADQQSSYKVTSQTMPVEERAVILIAPVS